jgi:RNA polymerase sigma factor (sigma-70 family)
MSMQTVDVSVAQLAHAAEPAARRATEDWEGVVERLLAGDREAQVRIARLVTGLLARWGAYDFRPEWPDLVQDVLLALVRAAREGRVENPAALVGYVRSIAHHKLMDRLRTHVRHAEAGSAPIDDAEALPGFDGLRERARQDVVADVRLALERLPAHKARVVLAVYGEGKTYEQVAEETGIPFGSVKRYLREGMDALRQAFEVDPGQE